MKKIKNIENNRSCDTEQYQVFIHTDGAQRAYKYPKQRSTKCLNLVNYVSGFFATAVGLLVIS